MASVKVRGDSMGNLEPEWKWRIAMIPHPLWTFNVIIALRFPRYLLLKEMADSTPWCKSNHTNVSAFIYMLMCVYIYRTLHVQLLKSLIWNFLLNVDGKTHLFYMLLHWAECPCLKIAVSIRRLKRILI